MDLSYPLTLHEATLRVLDCIHAADTLRNTSKERAELRFLTDGVILQLQEKLKLIRAHGDIAESRPDTQAGPQFGGPQGGGGGGRLGSSPTTRPVPQGGTSAGRTAVATTSSVQDSGAVLFCVRTTSSTEKTAQQSDDPLPEHRYGVSTTSPTREASSSSTPDASRAAAAPALSATTVTVSCGGQVPSQSPREQPETTEPLHHPAVERLTQRRGCSLEQAYQYNLNNSRNEMQRLLQVTRPDASAADGGTPLREAKSLFGGVTRGVSNASLQDLMERLRRQADETATLAFGHRDPRLARKR